MGRSKIIIGCVLIFGVAAGAVVTRPMAAGCTALRSSVFPADSGRLRIANGARFRSLVDTMTTNLARLEMHVTTLAPGKSPHAPHRHPHEEIMILQAGTLEVSQNDVTRRATVGAVIFEASNELHGLRNPGPDSATYVVIRIDPHDLATADTGRCGPARR